MTPEQGDSHSELDVSPEDLQKLTSLMDDSGSMGDLSEANDPEEPQAQTKPADPVKATPAAPIEGQAELVDVEIGGKTYKVPAEIKDGYLMQADYTRKTQEVATQRQTVEQQRAEVQRLAMQAQQFVGHYAAVKQIDEQLQQLSQINPQELANDPLRDMQVRQARIELSQARQNILGNVQQAQMQLRQHEALQTHQAVQQGREVLAKAIPDWDKPETQKAFVETAVSLGFKPEEAAATTDPRHIMVLNEIKTLRAKVAEYEAAKSVADKQVRAAPRPVVRAQASHDPADQPRQNEGLARLRKSGSDDDAVAALKALLG